MVKTWLWVTMVQAPLMLGTTRSPTTISRTQASRATPVISLKSSGSLLRKSVVGSRPVVAHGVTTSSVVTTLQATTGVNTLTTSNLWLSPTRH